MYVTGVNMASQVEDNKRECIVNVMNEPESNIKNVYEKCEQILKSDNETFQNKAESLVDAWKQLRLCGTTAKIQYVIHLLDWAKLHTLNIVLSGDWKKYKDAFELRLLNEVEICERELHKINNSFSLHCKKLAKVIRDPWGNATLCKLLNTDDPTITRLEFDFFIGESGYLVSMRLKKLCESHCEDLALNLVTAYMRCCEWAESNKFNMNLTEDQKRFMLDVYIALLYKYKKTPVIISTLKTLSLKEGLELVRRFAKKRVEISKLWRHSNRITHLSAVLFASSATIQPFEDCSVVLTDLVDVWLSLSDKEENNLEPLVASIKRVMLVATSACHMYIFCEAIYKKFGPKMKTFNIELCIQALTTDLNYLERQKNEDNKLEVSQTSQRLAHGFLRLADVLDEHLNVCRECVLTSFSLMPTKDSLQRIENLARRCGYEVLDTGQWKCKSHPPVMPSDELCTQCSDCGDFMGQMNLEAAINTNVALNEALTAERLGLSPQLCDDLVVLVCSPRYQLLSWLQKWPELHRLCIMYLNDTERTKNLVTELKFLEIDYSIFMNIKREPEEEGEEEEDEYPYECDDVVQSEFEADPNLMSDDDEILTRPGRRRVGRILDSPEPEPYVVPKPKSDPNVLKSLRSFRRSFKRPRDNESESVHPNKLFIDKNTCTSSPQETHSNSSSAQTLNSTYYPSNVNYDYYGNVNSSANNEYNSNGCNSNEYNSQEYNSNGYNSNENNSNENNSYEYNGYNFQSYSGSEIGNKNSSCVDDYNKANSQNFSNLTSVDNSFKIKLYPKPHPINKDNSTIVKEDCKRKPDPSTTNDVNRGLPKDCPTSITYTQDCSLSTNASSNKRNTDRGNSDKRSLHKGNFNKGNLNKGTVSKESLNKGNVNKASLNKGSSNKGSLNLGNLNKGSLNPGNLNQTTLNPANSSQGNSNAENFNQESSNSNLNKKDTYLKTANNTTLNTTISLVKLQNEQTKKGVYQNSKSELLPIKSSQNESIEPTVRVEKLSKSLTERLISSLSNEIKQKKTEDERLYSMQRLYQLSKTLNIQEKVMSEMNNLNPKRSNSEAFKKSDLKTVRNSDVEAAKKAKLEALKKSEAEAFRKSRLEALKKSEMEALKKLKLSALKKAESETTKKHELQLFQKSELEAFKRSELELARKLQLQSVGNSGVEAKKLDFSGKSNLELSINMDFSRNPDLSRKLDLSGKPDLSKKLDLSRKPNLSRKPDLSRIPDLSRRPEVELFRKSDSQPTRKSDLGLSRKLELELSRKPELQLFRKSEFNSSKKPEVGSSRKLEFETSRKPELDPTRKPDFDLSRRPQLELSKSQLESSKFHLESSKSQLESNKSEMDGSKKSESETKNLKVAQHPLNMSNSNIPSGSLEKTEYSTRLNELEEKRLKACMKLSKLDEILKKHVKSEFGKQFVSKITGSDAQKDAMQKILQKNDVQRNDVQSNDLQRNDVQSNDLQRNDVLKNDMHKKVVLKNDMHKDDVLKNDEHKNDLQKNDLLKNDLLANDLLKNDVQKNYRLRNDFQKRDSHKNNSTNLTTNEKNNIFSKPPNEQNLRMSWTNETFPLCSAINSAAGNLRNTNKLSTSDRLNTSESNNWLKNSDWMKNDKIHVAGGLKSNEGLRTFDGLRTSDELRSSDARTSDELRTSDGLRSTDGLRPTDGLRSTDEQNSFDGQKSLDCMKSTEAIHFCDRKENQKDFNGDKFFQLAGGSDEDSKNTISDSSSLHSNCLQSPSNINLDVELRDFFQTNGQYQKNLNDTSAHFESEDISDISARFGALPRAETSNVEISNVEIFKAAIVETSNASNVQTSVETSNGETSDISETSSLTYDAKAIGNELNKKQCAYEFLVKFQDHLNSTNSNKLHFSDEVTFPQTVESGSSGKPKCTLCHRADWDEVKELISPKITVTRHRSGSEQTKRYKYLCRKLEIKHTSDETLHKTSHIRLKAVDDNRLNRTLREKYNLKELRVVLDRFHVKPQTNKIRSYVDRTKFKGDYKLDDKLVDKKLVDKKLDENKLDVKKLDVKKLLLKKLLEKKLFEKKLVGKKLVVNVFNGKNLDNNNLDDNHLHDNNLGDNNAKDINLEDNNLEDNVLEDSIQENNIQDNNIQEDNVLEHNMQEYNILEANNVENNVQEVNIQEDYIQEDNIQEDNIQEDNIHEDNVQEENNQGDNILEDNILGNNIQNQKDNIQKRNEVQFLNNKNKQNKFKKGNRKNVKRSENKSKVPSPILNKDEYKNRSWPLQDVNPRVVMSDNKVKMEVLEKPDKPEKTGKPKNKEEKYLRVDIHKIDDKIYKIDDKIYKIDDKIYKLDDTFKKFGDKLNIDKQNKPDKANKFDKQNKIDNPKSDKLIFEKLKIDKSVIDKSLIDKPKIDKPNKLDNNKPDKIDKPKIHKEIKSSVETKTKMICHDKCDESSERIPRVLLQRLDVHAILANVPGLHDTEMMRPCNVNSIVQVVQVAGGRPTATVPTANNQTSTQVTPHIQRIGQPRIDKPDQTVVAEPSTTTTNTKSSPTMVTAKPVTSQPSTLINILSQQIIRPGQSNSTRPRTGPFINILSQQIVRPANTSLATVKTTETLANSSTTRIMSTGDPQVINQLVNPIRTSGTTLKTVVTNPGTDQSRIVQLICKSADGKLIPVTSFTPNRVLKVATTQTVTSSSPSSPNFEESLTKLVQVSPKPKIDATENSETLPKFQQAFGKTVYQNAVDSTNATVPNNTLNNVDIDKTKSHPKNSTTVNVQPIHGGVIYTRQVPVSQTINLIPPNRGQVFRIATSNTDQISLVKDTTVIHNKMSALLAAALQGKQKNSEVIEVDSSAETNTSQTNTRVALARPTLVHNARIVKPVLQIPSNVIRNAPQPNLSSTTLEQLREFDMVYKQVKERSSTTTPSDLVASETTEPSQRISVTYLNQPPKINCAPVVVVSSYNNLQPAASPALSVASQGSSSPCVTPAPTPTPVLPKVASKGSKGKSVKNATMHTSKASPVPKPQQKPQEDEHTTQRIFDILAEYAEQLRNSPDLNNKPAPRRRSNPPTNPSQNSKRKKSSGSKKSGQCSSTLTSEADLEDHRTIGSEDSSCGVIQVSMQDDDPTPVTVNATESNDSTIQPRQQLILTESTTNQTRNLIIADSSVGEALKMPNTAVLVPGNYIMPVSMVKGGQQIAVVSGGSKILATVPARSGPNMLLFQSFLNQTRKTTVPTVKYSAIQPIAGLSSQNITGVTTQQPVILQQPASHGISTMTLGQPLPIKKMEEPERMNTELLLTISQSRENDSSPKEEVPQPDSSTSIVSTNIESIDLEESATLSDTSSEKTYTYQKPLIATPIATPVIAQTNSKEDNSNKVEVGKVEERVQSVLVTAGTSNGPMLSHSPPRFTKQSECSGQAEQNKDDFLRNGGKRSSGAEPKNFQGNNLYTMHGKIKKAQNNSQKIDRELQQLCLQRKQAALERELRLQKSLSEECEDLGVDEPSTSDLFPEADLLFDSNHSPSFDQSSQDIVKRSIHCQENKEESKLTLFSDDDFLFEPGEYQTAETELEYDNQSRLLKNGQSSTSTESGSPCEDNTLLQTCTSMSDVTLNSPISPDTYHPTTPPPLNKYVHKYSNRKKDRLKQVENWPADVSSSEDTTGSTELIKSSSRSPELCSNKRSDEELSESSFKVVRVAISKSECDEIHCSEDADCSVSGRGARRSVKKMCSCCNGSQDSSAASRKRPSQQPHTPSSHKKAFLSKKR